MSFLNYILEETCIYPYTYVKVDGNFYKRLVHGDEQEFVGLEESFVDRVASKFIPINRTHITIPLQKLDADKEHSSQEAYDD
jgi:hypothetical protein